MRTGILKRMMSALFLVVKKLNLQMKGVLLLLKKVILQKMRYYALHGSLSPVATCE